MSVNLTKLKSDVLVKNESSDASDEEDDDMDELKEFKSASTEFPKDSKLTKEIIDKRREQNRVLARRTRQRKKSFFESLQKQATDLAKENEILKGLVKSKKTEELFNENFANSPRAVPLSNHFSNPSVTSNLSTDDNRLLTAIQSGLRSFVITNPALPDNPIVFANQGFHDLTGYSPSQVIGRNCRFLQGPGTNRRHVEVMRHGIATGEDTTVYIINYRIDGRPFYNHVFIAALRDTNNRIVNYVGLHVEVSETEAMRNSESSSIERVVMFDRLGDPSWRIPSSFSTVLSGGGIGGSSSAPFAPSGIGESTMAATESTTTGVSYCGNNVNDESINSNDKDDCMSDFDFDEFMQGSL